MNLATRYGAGLVMTVLGCSPAGAAAYRWHREGDAWALACDGQAVGRWLPETGLGLAAEDAVTALGDGVFRLQRTVRRDGEAAAAPVRLTLDFVHASAPAFLLVPAVSYDGNTWGRGDEPKGFRRDGQWWSFSSLRTPIPGATYSEGDRWAVALWGETGDRLPVLSCSLMPGDGQVTHRLAWPEEEQPLAYTGRDRYGPGVRGTLEPAPGEDLVLTGILVVDRVKPGHRAMATFLGEAWRQLRRERKPPARDPGETWRLAVTYARDSLWAEEGPFRGFSIGLVNRDGAWVQRPGWKYEIGWCGQNASLANSLLVDHLRTGDPDSREKALACLDSWAAHAVLPNGLFRTHFDHVLGIADPPEVLDACNLGTAALNYFEAFELAARCGVDRPRYRELALGICRFAADDQQPSGGYGKGWAPDGTCLYREGTIGAFLVPPMLQAYRVSGDERFLQSARRAFAFYFGEFDRLGYTSAGALDTWCIDKESAMPVLRSALALHSLTGDPAFLEAAERVSWYLSTWLWHVSNRYDPATDFARHGFDTFGGTSVSTQHHHLDPYALFWVPDWIDLAERTGNDTWREKALAIWDHANQLVSDGTLEIHGRVRPAGSQNEGFLHAPWGGGPGTLNDWLVAWPTALRLETLRRLGDWDVLR